MTAEINAMAFYHPNGLVPSWRQAAKFAGENGRVATIPDIVDARIAGGNNSVAWNSYFTTTTAEYYGMSKTNVPLLVIAHGVGPLSTYEKAIEVYRKDASGDRRNGRIDQKTFQKLADGHWGDVEVIDMNDYAKNTEHPYASYLSAETALDDEWFIARIGGYDRAQAYIEKLASMNSEVEGHHPSGRIITCDESQYAHYTTCASDRFKAFDVAPSFKGAIASGEAEANLLSIGGLAYMSVGGQPGTNLHHDLSVHEWHDGTRFAGFRAATHIIYPGFNERKISNEDPRLWANCENDVHFHVLMEVGEEYFTQYPKKGASLDTKQPMSRVLTSRDIGEPTKFVIESVGHYSMFKYAKSDVRRIAPAGANAYELLDCGNVDDDRQYGIVQFKDVTVDTTRRLMSSQEIMNDDDLVVAMAIEQAAS